MEMLIAVVFLALVYMFVGALAQFIWNTEFCADRHNYPKLHLLSAKDKESIGWLVFLLWPIPTTIFLTVIIIALAIWCITAPFRAICKMGEGFIALFKLLKGDKK